MRQKNREIKYDRRIRELLEKEDVVFYDFNKIKTMRQLIDYLMNKCIKLQELAFSRKDIERIIFDGDELKEMLLDQSLYDEIILYVKINMP